MYLLVQALNNIKSSIKILSFPFLARPSEAHTYKGIESHPGFHTTTSPETAAMYALGKVVQQNTVEEGDTYIVTDYPVVVGLNMAGYERELDYDAENFVRPGLETLLKDLEKNLPEDATDDDIYFMLEQDIAEFNGEPPYQKSPIDMLSENQFSYMFDPATAVLNMENPVAVVREYLETGQLSKEVLMAATDQYRYLNDVPHTQILKVWYVQPVAEDATDAMNGDEDAVNAVLEAWPGFTVVDYDDVYSGLIEPEFTEVWAGDNLEEISMEYHGTTYLRLLQAVPEFAQQLPEPPSPPYSS